MFTRFEVISAEFSVIISAEGSYTEVELINRTVLTDAFSISTMKLSNDLLLLDCTFTMSISASKNSEILELKDSNSIRNGEIPVEPN